MPPTFPAPVEKTWFVPSTPRLLAHRGFALEAPENTLLAFLKALALGAEYLETDVHASRDGVAIVCHDPDLSRIAGRPVEVRQLTVRELKEIRLAEGQSIPTLAEVLDTFPEARFNIDIKSADAVVPTANAILAARATGRVLIGSFANARRKAVVRRLPGVATSASPLPLLVGLIAARLGARAVVARALRGVDAVQIPPRYGFFRLVTRRSIVTFHAAGLEVHVWTINEPHEMRLLLNLGVDGLITDRIDLALGLRGAGN